MNQVFRDDLAIISYLRNYFGICFSNRIIVHVVSIFHVTNFSGDETQMHKATEMSTSLESMPLVQNVMPDAINSTRRRSGTFFSSVFALLTTCIGAGTLSLPYAFMNGGLIFSVIVFVAIMIMAIVIGFMLLESKHLVEAMGSKAVINNYADLGEYSFGVIGKVGL